MSIWETNTQTLSRSSRQCPSTANVHMHALSMPVPFTHTQTLGLTKLLRTWLLVTCQEPEDKGKKDGGSGAAEGEGALTPGAVMLNKLRWGAHLMRAHQSLHSLSLVKLMQPLLVGGHYAGLV